MAAGRRFRTVPDPRRVERVRAGGFEAAPAYRQQAQTKGCRLTPPGLPPPKQMADLEEAVIEKGTEVINFLREECRIPDEQCEQLEALITNTEDAKGWSPDGRELMERVEDVAKCQPYMPHDKYAEMLVLGWSAALDLSFGPQGAHSGNIFLVTLLW